MGLMSSLKKLMPSERSPAHMALPPGKFAEIHVPGVRFVGEQDGPSERLLKARLADMFRLDSTVCAAYLVRADLGSGNIGVVLGLRTASGPSKQIVEDVGKVFASIFARSQHLDILFLSQRQETDLKQVCKAFYIRPDSLPENVLL
jgi:hypothetical protein